MSNGKTIIDSKTANALASELTNLGRALLSVGEKIERLTQSSKLKKVKVSPKTDPDMFSKEFIATVKKSRKDFEKGRYSDYLEFRKTLDLK